MNTCDQQIIEPKEKVGLVVVITGSGKGKTTSAMGMVLRAVGHGLRVCVVQFMKGDFYSGETDGLRMLKPQVEHHIIGKGYYGIRGNQVPHNEHRSIAQEAIRLAKERMLSGKFDILICDEINNLVKLKLVDLSQVLDLIENKPPLVHLILTGRDAHPRVIEQGHTVSIVQEMKHAYREGIEAQKGIDY
ncbi:MAG: cob(I)yrinic acid a,c-diamide adenosyltransferase [Desulfomonilaceae bacterium]|nr:cob(I)yrinic acid a,c-diamide adenosyltransferase [Desulfomonilaceae bacterium]